MRIIDKLNVKQLIFMSDIGFPVIDKDYSEDEIFDISEKLKEHFLSNGLDKNQEPNDVGLMCEDIIYIFDEDLD